ncbi:MAG: hypothetical protein Q9160_001504 [Pyrenula sp. 1 TL-2023]
MSSFTNPPYFLPIFRTTSFLLATLALTSGISAAIQPAAFAENFGLPFPPAPAPSNKAQSSEKEIQDENKDTIEQQSPQTLTHRTLHGLLTVVVGRNFSIAAGTYALLYANELRALSLVMLTGQVSLLADCVGLARYGTPRGRWVAHAVAGGLGGVMGAAGLWVLGGT